VVSAMLLAMSFVVVLITERLVAPKKEAR